MSTLLSASFRRELEGYFKWEIFVFVFWILTFFAVATDVLGEGDVRDYYGSFRVQQKTKYIHRQNTFVWLLFSRVAMETPL